MLSRQNRQGRGDARRLPTRGVRSYLATYGLFSTRKNRTLATSRSGGMADARDSRPPDFALTFAPFSDYDVADRWDGGMADAIDSKSIEVTHEGSSPSPSTKWTSGESCRQNRVSQDVRVRVSPPAQRVIMHPCSPFSIHFIVSVGG